MEFNTYSEGYSKGVVAGKAKKDSSDNNSSSNPLPSGMRSSSSQGAYRNTGSVILALEELMLTQQQ